MANVDKINVAVPISEVTVKHFISGWGNANAALFNYWMPRAHQLIYIMIITTQKKVKSENRISPTAAEWNSDQ